MGRVSGKVVIVTGAARGQGEAEAQMFAAEGAKVLMGDVLDDQGHAVAEHRRGRSLRASRRELGERLGGCHRRRARGGGGRVDGLVNNAAIIRPAAIEDTSLEDYMSVINVNQVGTFLGMKSVIGPMKKVGGGAIVNISSIDGIQSKNGLISYSASKFAIRGMTKTAALEWGRFGVRVNSVHPGGVNTLMGNPFNEPALEKMPYQFQAIPRIGYPDEIAAAVLFLISDEASYITGAELSVDGGWVAGRLEPGLPGSGRDSAYGYTAPSAG